MESALRPRDIQARIRAGDTPQAVAELAQVPVDQIMGFAVPVLAERVHIAEQAQRTALRRKGGEGPGRILGDAVAERMRGGPAGEADGWDAWRGPDGRWIVSVVYRLAGRERVARFRYDQLGRYVVPADDDARWMVGDPGAAVESGATERRLTAVAPAGPDDERKDTVDLAELGLPQVPATEPAGGQPQPEWPAAQAVGDDLARPDRDSRGAAAADEGGRKGRRTRRRASIPSWDEIMFGPR